MTDYRALIDAFADARGTWDELVGMQPDTIAAGGQLEDANLAELERRVEGHRSAMDGLAEVLQAEQEDDSWDVYGERGVRP